MPRPPSYSRVTTDMLDTIFSRIRGRLPWTSQPFDEKTAERLVREFRDHGAVCETFTGET